MCMLQIVCIRGPNHLCGFPDPSAGRRAVPTGQDADGAETGSPQAAETRAADVPAVTPTEETRQHAGG